jgi:hypothetical protein
VLVVVLGFDVVELEDHAGFEGDDEGEKPQASAQVGQPFDGVRLHGLEVVVLLAVYHAAHRREVALHPRCLVEIQVEFCLVFSHDLVTHRRHCDVHFLQSSLLSQHLNIVLQVKHVHQQHVQQQKTKKFCAQSVHTVWRLLQRLHLRVHCLVRHLKLYKTLKTVVFQVLFVLFVLSKWVFLLLLRFVFFNVLVLLRDEFLVTFLLVF